MLKIRDLWLRAGIRIIALEALHWPATTAFLPHLAMIHNLVHFVQELYGLWESHVVPEVLSTLSSQSDLRKSGWAELEKNIDALHTELPASSSLTRRTDSSSRV